MLKENILIVTLAICLVATLFMGISTSMNHGAVADISKYNPWADLNDDGVIDSTDLGILGTSWATTGNATKPVVINHNWIEGNFGFNLAPSKYTILNITVTGFRTVTIRIIAYSIDTHNFQLSILPKIRDFICDRLDYNVASHTPFKPPILPPYPWYFEDPASFKMTYEVTFSELMIGIYNPSTSYNLWGNIFYYLNT